MPKKKWSYKITDEDVNDVADILDVSLTDEQRQKVHKYFENAMGFNWRDNMEIAIKEAIEE